MRGISELEVGGAPINLSAAAERASEQSAGRRQSRAAIIADRLASLCRSRRCFCSRVELISSALKLLGELAAHLALDTRRAESPAGLLGARAAQIGATGPPALEWAAWRERQCEKRGRHFGGCQPKCTAAAALAAH